MRVSYSYKKYKNCFLATAVSWLGSILSLLVLYGAMYLLAISVLGLFTGDDEALVNIFVSLVLMAFSFGLRLLSGWLGDLIAMGWRKLTGSKESEAVTPKQNSVVERPKVMSKPPMERQVPVTKIEEIQKTKPVSASHYSVQIINLSAPNYDPVMDRDDYDGPLLLLPALEIIVIEREVVTLGRDSRSPYILNAVDPQLSGRHFSLMVQQGVLYIRDENSTNGTHVDDKAIFPNVWVPCRHGDRVKAGKATYEIHASPIITLFD